MARVIGTQIERETPSGDIVIEYFPEEPARDPSSPLPPVIPPIPTVAFEGFRIDVSFFANGKLHDTKWLHTNP